MTELEELQARAGVGLALAAYGALGVSAALSGHPPFVKWRICRRRSSDGKNPDKDRYSY